MSGEQLKIVLSLDTIEAFRMWYMSLAVFTAAKAPLKAVSRLVTSSNDRSRYDSCDPLPTSVAQPKVRVWNAVIVTKTMHEKVILLLLLLLFDYYYYYSRYSILEH